MVKWLLGPESSPERLKTHFSFLVLFSSLALRDLQTRASGFQTFRQALDSEFRKGGGGGWHLGFQAIAG